MPVDKSDAQKAREVQDRPVYRRNCSICARSFYDSLVGPCPERDGRKVCMYCCRMCQQSYKGVMGWGCRVKDAARRKGKKPAAAGERIATGPQAPRNDGKGDVA